MTRRGVGYIRISDKKQIEGESPETQMRVISEYAERENIEIIEWFYDEAKSGRNADRVELQNLLSFVAKRASKINCVVTFKMSRASRDALSYYSQVKMILSGKGIQIRSATEPFDDSPIGRFMEGSLVLNAQLDNEIKSSQVTENMISLAMQGYWQHKPILGYKQKAIPNGAGKMRPTMEPGEQSSLVKIVLERFSKGDLTRAKITLYAKDIGLRGTSGAVLRQEAVVRLLKRPEYAGYAHGKLTNYELVEGKHEAIIDKDTYWTNQKILDAKTKIGEVHTSTNKDYPLKQIASCSNCEQPLYGSAPKSGGGRYSPRYHCARVQCRRKSSSIKAEKLHDRYLELLSKIQPNDKLINLLKTVTIRKAKMDNQSINTIIASKRAEVGELASTRLETIEESVKTKYPERKQQLLELITHYDQKKIDMLCEIRELESQQALQEAKIEYIVRHMYDIAKQWDDADFDLKLKFQTMVFPEGIKLDTKTGDFGTPKISPLYRYIDNKKDPSVAEKSHLVTLPGIEPGLPD
jgi:site-specific DNA recombinase